MIFQYVPIDEVFHVLVPDHSFTGRHMTLFCSEQRRLLPFTLVLGFLLLSVQLFLRSFRKRGCLSPLRLLPSRTFSPRTVAIYRS